MRLIALVLVCMGCWSHSQRLRTTPEHKESQAPQANALTRLLLARGQPTAAWQVATQGMHAQQVFPRHEAVSMKDSLSDQRPKRVSRRSALTTISLALAALAAPQSARAVLRTSCDCSGGADKCVCTQTEVEEGTSRFNGGDNRVSATRDSEEKDQAITDAALGRQGKKQKSNSIWFGKALDTTEPDPKPRFLTTQSIDFNADLGKRTPTYFELERNRADKEMAKDKFASLVAATVAQREKELGIEFDEKDIEELGKALKPTYCGREAPYGAC